MSIYQSCTDQQLISLLKSGNDDAFTEIYDRYWGILYRHARKILYNDDEVSDIIQEIFVNLWTKGQELELSSSLSSYLYAAVRNRIFNYLDHGKIKEKYISSLGSFLLNGEYTTDNRIRENELAALIEKEIAALPEKMREVFELSRKSNLSYKEIGEQLGLADSTVKNQISKAIKILRLKFGGLALLYLFLHP
ncbi:RNA polymerase sigma factor [Pedobacter caeni]|uniref:RNA polymerase sigma-70 factor, ECF subfamily n=1 Tax=Pedobacter caeni TaxID=288992 RepID=A0A1M5BAE9_9SPHI|nr:RNA polymerase sigma-70 factor [Pedobacter caeni]SHF39386.1 RNA polymerase sigma-70 factor, ECF subfamily [Pedobacter caeni]